MRFAAWVLLTISLLTIINSVSADEPLCVKNKLVLYRDARYAVAGASVSKPKLSSIFETAQLSENALSISLPDVQAASVSKKERHVESCAQAAARCSEIRSNLRNSSWKCEPDYVIKLSNTPNDPYFSSATLNKKKYAGDQKAAIALINPEAAWDIHTGANEAAAPLVAVIDTGIDLTHPDLSANVWSNAGEIANNGIDDDQNGYVDDKHGWDFFSNDNDPSDDNGHGTHVSGTIGAQGNNGLGVAGIVWKARIMGLKFLGADGSGSTSGAIAAINYAAQMGAKVLNNSWGGGGYSAALQVAISNAAQKGALVVVAAGNEANNNDAHPSYPASMQDVLAVAAVDKAGQLASFSNYGANSVQIAAPGVNILSSWPGGYYAWSSGTSMAAPHISGAAALALSLYPELSAEQLKNLIINTGSIQYNLNGKVQSSAMLDLAALVKAVKAIRDGSDDGQADSPADPQDSNPVYSAQDAVTLSGQNGAPTLSAGRAISLAIETAQVSSVLVGFKVGRFDCSGSVVLDGMTPGVAQEFSAKLVKQASGMDTLEANVYSLDGALLASTSASIKGKGIKQLSAPKASAAKVCKKLLQSLQ